MRRNNKYETPDIEITKFVVDKRVMVDFETENGDKVHFGESQSEYIPPDLGEDW